MSSSGTSIRQRTREVPIGWWIVICALACLAFGAPPLVDSLRFVAAAEQATGVIIEVMPASGKFKPIVQFTGPDGRPLRFTASQSAGDRSHFRVGDPIGVLYAPHNPADARLDTWQSRWPREAVIPGLGLFMLVLGVLSLRQSRHDDGPFQAERHFPTSAVATYTALNTAVTTRFRVHRCDQSTMRIRFTSPINVFTWGETFTAQVRPAPPGAVVHVTGAGHIPTVLWQTWRLRTLVDRLFADITTVLDATNDQAAPRRRFDPPQRTTA